jgi:cellulose synthase/poly-beta-1,6-N-acetylglucosamine synthase-like glycosyltransferase
MRDLFIYLYFFLLFYVAFYGIHIYWLVTLYVRHRADVKQPPPLGRERPSVTVQLPVYNEKTVVVRLISAAAELDWPKEKLEIQVLDDSDDETTSLIANEVCRLQQESISIHHIRRGTRAGYKSGALAQGLREATGELIAVFDADNLPRPNFLRQIVGYFSDPEIGLVQARWSFLNRDESLLCRAQALFLDAHFYVEQAARAKGGLFMNFNGTAGVWRRKTIEDSGSWQSDTLTEDLDLSYRAQMVGWQMVFAEDVDVPTELPSSIRAFKTQQFRWAKGAFQTGLKLLPRLLSSHLTFKVKAASFFHLTQKSVSLALLVLSLLLIPALYIRLESGMLKVLFVDLPIFFAGTVSTSIFYGLAYKREKTVRSIKNALLLPVLTSLGIGLAVNNSLAVILAIFGRNQSFIRTPKTGGQGEKSLALPIEYRIPFDYTAKAEALLAMYTLIAIGCALSLKLFFTIPLLTTFTFGYVYFSILSLREEYA